MESTGQPLEAGFWKANPHTNIVSVLAPLWKVECPKNEWIMTLPLPPVQQDVIPPGFSLGFFLPVEVNSEIREMQKLDRQTVWEKGLKASLGPFTSFPFSICLWSPGALCYQALGGQGHVTGICSHLGGSLRDFDPFLSWVCAGFLSGWFWCLTRAAWVSRAKYADSSIP